MAKLDRKTQKIFGSSAGSNERAVIGSLAAAAPAFSTDPETIQSLSQYLEGWFSTVLGSNSPAIEDMNSLCFLFAYQLAYIFEQGIPEWDDGTTYYLNSVVQSSGVIYRSLANSNTNNAVTDATKWVRTNGLGRTVRTITSGALLATDDFVRVNGTGASYSKALPSNFPVGVPLTVKNVSTDGSTVTLTATDIDGAGSIVLGSDPTRESVDLMWNGTSWDII